MISDFFVYLIKNDKQSTVITYPHESMRYWSKARFKKKNRETLSKLSLTKIFQFYVTEVTTQANYFVFSPF